jgi:SAM-dependent methyltransferase
MAKLGEISYIAKLTDAEVRHAVHKPFSDPYRADFLRQVAAILSILPPPPARLLDLGCGTGWTSTFFARSGYHVVGVDICPDMIRLAEDMRLHAGLENLRFLVSDYEELRFREEFDAAVFFDSLHHAVDEALAMRKAYEALRPGGCCITSEPGEGHHASEASRRAVSRFGVTEKDMPPFKVLALGEKAGFRESIVFPHDNLLVDYADRTTYHRALRKRGLFKRLCFRLLRALTRMERSAFDAYVPRFWGRLRHLRDFHRLGGIVCLVK